MGGLELNFLGCLHCRFVQTMTETVHHFDDTNLTGRRKYDIEQDFALNLQLAAFVSVNRTRLVGNLNRKGL